MAGAPEIRALVLDVDGVLTDGRVMFSEAGQEMKHLRYHDIDAVFQARREGFTVALVTGEQTPMVGVIARTLGVELVLDGAKDKAAALRALAARLAIPLTAICYVADSDRDAPALELAGLGLAPADGSLRARRAARAVLASRGGQGVVAEALKAIRALNRAVAAGGLAEAAAGGHGETADVARRCVAEALEESIAVTRAVIDTLSADIAIAAGWMANTLRGGGKLLLFGNGGSAASAQHVAAEFIGRFERDRRPWPVIALNTDTAALTALVNDYGAEQLFARQMEALGRCGDLALALSTSGDSPNVLQGVVAARTLGLRVVGLTGATGGRLAPLCDLALRVPSRRTPRIQESHIAICHAMCEVVEAALAGEA
jgi:D-sedoheptulose 7-phosphate isomerase